MCKEGRELTFKLPLCLFTFGSYFSPPTPPRFYTSISSAFFWHLILFKQKKKKNHKEEKICREGREFTFKFLFCLLTFVFHFCPPAFALPFQAFSPSIFFFSNKRKEKKRHRKKKNVEKGRNFPLSSQSAFSFQVLSFDIFFFANRRKEKKTQKKNPGEKKNAKKGRSLPFFSRFYIWDEALLLLSPLHISSTLSFPPFSIFKPSVFISSKLCATQAHELSRALEME
jgi:hypothetical protein